MLGRRNPPDSTYDFLSDPTGLPSEFKGWLRNWLLNQPATTTGTAVALPTGNAGGDLAGSTYPSPVLKASGVTAATYGDATHVGQVAVSAKGLVTSASNVSITGTPPGGSAGGDLTGTYPNPTLGTAGPGATGPIGDTTHTPVITIDAKGRVTALTSAVISGGGGGSVATDAIWTTKGDLAAATGSAAAVRVGVGANGLALVTDSAQTAGVKWGTASAVAARATNSANISVADSTFTALTFNTNTYDTSSIHSTSTNTSRFVAPSTGKYVVAACAEYAASSTGIRELLLRVNGTSYVSANVINNAGVATEALNVSVIVSLTATDYIELIAWQNSGGALNIDGSSSYTPMLSIALVGA